MTGKYALVIGNSEYKDPKFSKLICPCEDVQSLEEVLKDQDIAGFEVETLYNEGERIVKQKIQSFFLGKRPDDVLLFYFSGHGEKDIDGNLYLAVFDTELSFLRSTGIAASEITYLMNKSSSQCQVLILDNCFAGAFAHSKGVDKEVFRGNGYGHVVIAATGAAQVAYEGMEFQNDITKSLLTNFIIEGLRTGEADVDKDGDITVNNLFQYVSVKIGSITKKQTPSFWTYDQNGEITIARCKKNQRLNELYRRAREERLNKNWQGALDLLLKIEQEEPGFSDTRKNIQEIRDLLSWTSSGPHVNGENVLPVIKRNKQIFWLLGFGVLILMLLALYIGSMVIKNQFTHTPTPPTQSSLTGTKVETSSTIEYLEKSIRLTSTAFEAEKKITQERFTEAPSPSVSLEKSETFTEAPSEAIIKIRTYLRKAPYTSPNLEIKALNKGDEVIVISREPKNQWLWVRTVDGIEGWLYMDWIEMNFSPTILPTVARTPTPIPPDPTSRPGPKPGYTPPYP